jgi:hypothetical protein
VTKVPVAILLAVCLQTVVPVLAAPPSGVGTLGIIKPPAHWGKKALSSQDFPEVSISNSFHPATDDGQIILLGGLKDPATPLPVLIESISESIRRQGDLITSSQRAPLCNGAAEGWRLTYLDRRRRLRVVEAILANHVHGAAAIYLRPKNSLEDGAATSALSTLCLVAFPQ